MVYLKTDMYADAKIIIDMSNMELFISSEKQLR